MDDLADAIELHNDGPADWRYVTLAGEVLEPDGTLTEISSFDDWLAAGTELQAVAGGHGISYGYVNDGAQMWRMFATFYFQHGAEMSLVPGEPSGIVGLIVDTGGKASKPTRVPPSTSPLSSSPDKGSM